MNFKSREEYEKANLYFTRDNCPFCTKLNRNKIIFESDFWFVMHNDIPYFEDKNGLMAIPKRHIEFSVDLTKEEFADFLEVEKFMKNYYKNK
jgi:diadenosine tetraphosphate (Ap4A) HIT family hydrolase